MLTENALWDEEKQTLTLRIPIEEFSDLYTPVLLSSGEYGAMTQWVAKRTPVGWEYAPNVPPETIQKNINIIFNNLRLRKQKDIYNNELSRIGFTLSKNSNNILKNFIHPESLNNKTLLQHVEHISNHFPRIHGKTEYKLYTGPVA
jgi:hypothetical protein